LNRRYFDINSHSSLIMKRLIIILVIVILATVAAFAFLIIYATITDYKPEEIIVIQEHETIEPLNDSAIYSLMIWNIGYCGLEAGMDFFYDGGTKVRTTKDNTIKNIQGISSFIKAQDSIDFIMLQEVDIKSKRSYSINQYDSLAVLLPNYNATFALNYKVFFVPVPVTEPMGKVRSGIASFSKSKPLSSKRYNYPSKYGWPKSLFMLDRCFLVNRYSLTNNKQLLVINTHNSAFSDAVELRKQEMDYLRVFVLEEYAKGNYVVVGGDWNQYPPYIQPAFKANIFDESVEGISPEYLPNSWKWIYSNDQPTNRQVIKAYEQHSTPTSLIDYFLISPNIETLGVETINLNFEYSDHNPVKMKIKLIQ